MRLAGAVAMILGCSAARTPAPSTTTTVLTVPRAFRASRSVALLTSAGNDTVSAEARVRLLRGAGVPEAFSVTFRPPRMCGATDGEVRLVRVETGTGAPITAALEAGAVVLQSRASGAGEVVVHGEYVHGTTTCDGAPAAGARMALRATLHVEVSDNPGHLRERCGSPIGSFAGTAATVPLSLQLVDDANEAVYFDNLSPNAPFDLRIETSLPVSLTQGDRLRLPERPGIVHLSAPGRTDAWTWRWRIAPAEVTDATVRFFIPGNAGTPLDVTEGAHHTGGHRKTRGVFFEVRGVTVGDRPLCDLPDARWFRLVSETPEVCAVVPVNDRRCDQCGGPQFGQEAARLVRDGLCTLRLEAPALNHGRGWVRRVSAYFDGVENLYDLLRP